MKKRILFGVICGFFAVVLAWAKSEVPLIADLFYQNAVLTVIYGVLNFPILIGSILIGISSPVWISAMFFAQWFLIGFLIAWVVERIRAPHNNV